MKSKVAVLLVVIFSILFVNSAFAQVEKGDKYVGAALGIWWGIGFSGNFEYIFNEIQDVGFLGFGVEAGFSSRGDLGFTWNYIPVFGWASFHYTLKNSKLDPYARAGLGYVFVGGGDDVFGAHESYFAFAGQVGVRYAFSEKLLGRLALGTPWYVSFGVDLEL